MKTSEIRKKYLKYFEKHGHEIVESVPLIPQDDPTLLWINSGVAGLKKYFDGSSKPTSNRLVNSQKCIRTNDIDNVGLTARHHTLFEMLGNFSIGDYFREEAINYTFNFFTQELGIDRNKLYITVYPSDEDTYNVWKSIGIEDDHLIKTDYNFWEVGEGPCGPCTEIFYDRGTKYDDEAIKGKTAKEVLAEDIENDRYIELGNVVLSQFNSEKGIERSKYKELPSKNIDTGMGLERIACILQGAETNYETDGFLPIIKQVEKDSGVKYVGQHHFKIVSDHMRTVVFAISDGAMISNEGRGYVLRRLVRRAVKHLRNLNINEPYLYKLVDIIVEQNKEAFPRLVDSVDIAKKLIKTEEEKFLSTLVLGEKKLNELVKDTKDILSGKDAFLLFDTFGFPIELTVEYLEEINIKVDVDGFHEEMEKQKARARGARSVDASMAKQKEEFINFKEESIFDYDSTSINAKVIKVFNEGVILDKTCFYATSGGQHNDIGTIDGIEVTDVIKLVNGQHLHVVGGEFKEGQEVIASIDSDRRSITTKNHSATHLLYSQIRDVVGPHVSQQGSNVTDKALRFDFNNFDSLSDETLLNIENKVNDVISNANNVETIVATIEEAQEMGAIAEFGEKYADKVRVVKMWVTTDLCGGTHVNNTKDIERIAITSIESKGSGIYRIEAATSYNIISQLEEVTKNVRNSIETLISKGDSIVEEAKIKGILLTYKKPSNDIEKDSYKYVMKCKEDLAFMQEEIKNLDKEYQKSLSGASLDRLKDLDNMFEDDKLITTVSGIDTKALKEKVDNLLSNKEGFVFIANIVEDKIVFIAKTTNKKYHCGNIVKEAAIITGGNGGGRPDFAQAGGIDVSKVEEALSRVKELV